MGLVDMVQRIVIFLRAGYPSAMPATGYVPLLALVPRRAPADETAPITSNFTRHDGLADRRARMSGPQSAASLTTGSLTRCPHRTPSTAS
jgi:Protein of unknown function (DUF3349)